MHIHHAAMNLQPSLRGADAALAARRAEDARKKLLAASSSLEAASTPESAWMIGAWAGQNNPGSPPESAESSQGRDNDKPEEPAFRGSANSAAQQSSSPAESRPVSYWA